MDNHIIETLDILNTLKESRKINLRDVEEYEDKIKQELANKKEKQQEVEEFLEAEYYNFKDTYFSYEGESDEEEDFYYDNKKEEIDEEDEFELDNAQDEGTIEDGTEEEDLEDSYWDTLKEMYDKEFKF